MNVENIELVITGTPLFWVMIKKKKRRGFFWVTQSSVVETLLMFSGS